MLKTKSLKSISALALSTALQLSLLLFFSQNTFASTYYSGGSGETRSLEQVMSNVRPGQVLILSELHDSAAHHQNQVEFMKDLIRLGQRFSVGMEFFDYTQQAIVDNFFFEKISESDFLQQIGWGKALPFEFYRFQVRIPKHIGGKTMAINLPRAIANKVSQMGLESLTAEERALLPPNFEMGRESYFERFAEVMKGHANEKELARYFTAQSLWDDTMAWRAARFIQGHPEQVFVIIVGDFHVAYQDGLIARLRARGVTDILSISQIDTEGLSEQEKFEMIMPNSKYGARADFIFDVQ